MKLISRRVALPAIIAALSAITKVVAAAEPEKIRDQNILPVVSPDLKTLQKSMQPFAVQWWTVKHAGRTFHFCREELPFITVSSCNIHGWFKVDGDGDERLFHVWSARTQGIRDIRLDIDEAAGTVSIVALDSKLKGKQVAFYALDACDP